MKKTAIIISLCAAILAPAALKAEPVKTADYKDVQKILAGGKGKVVLLAFFATWCPPCREEVPTLIKLYSDYKSQGLELIGLSLDQTEPSKIQEFVDSNHINYPVYIVDEHTPQVFEVSAIPTMIFFSKDGTQKEPLVGLHEEQDLRKTIEDLLK